MKLKDLIATYPHILDIPIELLECLDWSKLEESKDDYTFISSEPLVGSAIQKIESGILSNPFWGKNVIFKKIGDKIILTDTYNKFVEEIDIYDKVKLFHHILYYWIEMEQWEELYKTLEISVRDYKKLKERLND